MHFLSLTNGKKIYELKDYEGKGAVTSTFMDSLSCVRELDEYGYLKRLSLTRGKNNIEKMEFTFDRTRDNLMELKRKGDFGHYFEYDILDRLVTVKRDRRMWMDIILPQPQKLTLTTAKDTVMTISYSADGNILHKTGIGGYTYAENVRPHAVVSVDNNDGKIPSTTLNTIFNHLDRIQTIEDEATGLAMEFNYGPDLQRWSSKIASNGCDSITTVYAGNYEKITVNGRTREFYYLAGGAILIKENGTIKPYIAFTDYLGSIMSVADENGSKVFDASYDAWGVQSIKTNNIGLRRGYTGHEMLPEFGIINMNGRLYDPQLGRFFSPDPIVQLPENTQNYNRYSYCLNNPLKYNDPSGQIFESAIIFGIYNLASSMIQAAGNGKNIWKAGGLSLLSSAASFGIGQYFGSVTTIGKELLRAGAHGAASGVLSMLDGGNLASGFLSGATASGIGSLPSKTNGQWISKILAGSFTGGFVSLVTGGE